MPRHGGEPRDPAGGLTGLVVAEETFDYESPVPLFESGMEACLHGLSGIEEPGPEARAMIDKLSRKLGGEVG